MKHHVNLLVAVLLIIPVAENAKILFVLMTPSVSHQSVFQPIWKEMSLRGHEVHVITPNPLKDPSIKNLHEIDLGYFYDQIGANVSDDMMRYIMKKPDFLTVFLKDSIMTGLWSMLAEKVFMDDNVQKLIHGHHEFDTVVVEWLYPTMAAFGAKYKCPIIGITSLGAPIPALDTVGNPSHPIYAPDHNLPVSRAMPFREKIMSALYAVYVRVFYHLVVLPREDKLAKKYLGDDLPYIGDIERNISLLLLNRNPIFHRVMPVVPAVIELGGMKLTKKIVPIEPELKRFLDQSKTDVIYFSFGSNIKSTHLSQETKNVILTTFAQLPFYVVLKWEDDVLPGKPNNMFIQRWLPQNELLGHKNVRLFITQGGLQSMEDAIRNGVPIIGVPFPSDQTSNVDTAVTYGMGLGIDIEDLTVANLNDSIHKIMSDKSFTENTAKLRNLLYDQPTDGLKRAVWWIEYVLRHKGAGHLRSPSMDISWFQFLLLDVMGMFLAILLLTLFISYKSVSLSIRLIKYIVLPKKKRD